MLLIATASYLQTDLILTADKHDFKPLADKMGVFCQAVYRENFKIIEELSLFDENNKQKKIELI